MPTSGTVIATIPAAVAVGSVSGFANPASTSTDNVVTWNSPTAPSLRFLDTIVDATNLGGAFSVAAYGNYAVVTKPTPTGRLTLIDCTDPTNISVVSSLSNSLLTDATDVVINGALAYVACHNDSLAVCNLSAAPSAPTILGSVTDGSALGSGRGIGYDPVTELCWVCGFNNISSVDVSNPASPTVVGNLINNTHFNSCRMVALSGSTAFVASSGNHKVVAVDISNPASPTWISTFDGNFAAGSHLNSLRSPETITIIGDVAYVAGDKILQALDISNPASIVSVGREYHTVVTFPVRMSMLDGYLIFASASYRGIGAVDISNPTAPVLVRVCVDDTNINVPARAAATINGAVIITNGSAVSTFDFLTPNPAAHVVGRWPSVRGTTSGPVSVAVYGDYVVSVISQTDQFSVFDASNPEVPRLIATLISDTTIDFPTDVAMYGNYAIVCSTVDSMVAVIDMSSPSFPTVVGTVTNATTLASPQALTIWGNYAVVTCFNRVTVVDLSTPTAPTITGSLLGSLDFLGNNQFGGAVDVAMYGNYAIVVAVNSQWVHIVDVSTPSSPTIVGSIRDTTNIPSPRAVAVYQNYAVVGAGTSRVSIVNLSTPTAPTLTSSFTSSTVLASPQGILIVDDCAVVTNVGGGTGGQRITVLDLSNPALPAEVGTLKATTNLAGAFGIGAFGDHVAVACRDADSVAIVDLSEFINGPRLSIVGFLDSADWGGDNPRSVKVVGNYAYLTDFSSRSFIVVDVSDRTNPTYVTKITDFANWNQLWGLDVVGNYAYVCARSSDRLSIIDISNPTSPSVVGTVTNATTLNGANEVSVVGNYAYVTCGFSDDRFTVVDVSTPSAPTIVGSVTNATTLDAPFGVMVVGSVAYVACNFGDRLTTVDVSTPTAPTVTAAVAGLDGANRLVVVGSYAYVTLDSASITLGVVNVSNPASPAFIASVAAGSSPFGIGAGDGYLYTTDFSNDTLYAFSLANPALPVQRHALKSALLEDPGDIDVVGNHIFVTSAGISSAGLAIVEFS